MSSACRSERNASVFVFIFMKSRALAVQRLEKSITLTVSCSPGWMGNSRNINWGQRSGIARVSPDAEREKRWGTKGEFGAK